MACMIEMGIALPAVRLACTSGLARKTVSPSAMLGKSRALKAVPMSGTRKFAVIAPLRTNSISTRSTTPVVAEAATADAATVKAVFAEFVATFLFVGIGVGTAIGSGFNGAALDPARVVQISLAFGYAISVLANSIGAISGGHINPAVTFAFVITNRLSAVKGAMYAAAQSLGAILAVALIKFATPAAQAAGSWGSNGLAAGVSVTGGLLLEIFGTFTLVWTVFATAVDKRGPGSIAALIIGLAVGIAHLALVPFTGCGINPARSLGSAFIAGDFTNFWIFVVGPFIGAGLAAIIYDKFLME